MQADDPESRLSQFIPSTSIYAVSRCSLPSYCVEGTGKEPGEMKDVALALKDWGDSGSIYEATTNMHGESNAKGRRWRSTVTRNRTWTRFIFSTTY